MKKSVFLLFILIQISTYSQSCLPEGFHFIADSQLHSFSNMYPECKKIEGAVTIGAWGGGDRITSLEELNQLTSFGSHVNIIGNERLVDLTGLDSLNSIGGYLFIWDNAELTNLDALSELKTIGNALVIVENESLSNIQGLSAVSSVGAELRIDLNNNLEELAGLEQLESIGTFLTIKSNERLIDISGVKNIDPNSINGKFEIYNNPLLSVCSNELVCDFLNISADSLVVYDNAVGCEDVSQIESSCDTLSVFNQNLEEEIVIFPNPTNQFITFKTPQESKVDEVIIYDMTGQVLMKFISKANTIDISGLNQGVFILELVFEQVSPVRRVIVKE